MEKVNFSEFSPVNAQNKSSACSISIINTKENGSRVKISKGALHVLGDPETVQVSLSQDTLLMASVLAENPTHFNVSKGNLYASALVRELTKHFDLDFSHKTSFTYSGIEFELDSGITALLFKIA